MGQSDLVAPAGNPDGFVEKTLCAETRSCCVYFSLDIWRLVALCVRVRHRYPESMQDVPLVARGSSGSNKKTMATLRIAVNVVVKDPPVRFGLPLRTPLC